MYYEFREPTTESEYRALLGVHDAVYGASADLSEFVSAEERSSGAGDGARHFGLFKCQDNQSRAVGYVRVVESYDSGSPELPLLDYFSRVSRVEEMLSTVVQVHGMAIECGRLSLLREVNSARVTKQFCESVVALYGVTLNAPMFLVCFPHHQRFYEALGFRRIFSDESIRTPCGELSGICMYGVRIHSPRVLARARAMAHAYEKFGAIAYHPTSAQNFTPEVVRPMLAANAAKLVSRVAA